MSKVLGAAFRGKLSKLRKYLEEDGQMPREVDEDEEAPLLSSTDFKPPVNPPEEIDDPEDEMVVKMSERLYDVVESEVRREKKRTMKK